MPCRRYWWTWRVGARDGKPAAKNAPPDAIDLCGKLSLPEAAAASSGARFTWETTRGWCTWPPLLVRRRSASAERRSIGRRRSHLSVDLRHGHSRAIPAWLTFRWQKHSSPRADCFLTRTLCQREFTRPLYPEGGSAPWCFTGIRPGQYSPTFRFVGPAIGWPGNVNLRFVAVLACQGQRDFRPVVSPQSARVGRTGTLRCRPSGDTRPAPD